MADREPMNSSPRSSCDASCTHPRTIAHSHAHPDGPHENDIAFVSCVKHRYEDGTSVELCGIDFCAHRGERTVLLGPNGAGKSTLLFHLLGLLKSQEGMVRVFGKDPATHWKLVRQRIGVVLQNVDQQLIMPTVYDDIAFSPRQYGAGEGEVDTRVRSIAATLGIGHLLNRAPQGLSGGEKRKVALAGALVTEPELLILDEPFEGLDPAARSSIISLLNGLVAERGVTLVMSTHDIDAVGEFADFCYVLRHGGEIALAGPPQEVFAHAELLERSNIRPPLVGALFAGLADVSGLAPAPALTTREAVGSLMDWHSALSKSEDR